jgi:hypothetical protein
MTFFEEFSDYTDSVLPLEKGFKAFIKSKTYLKHNPSIITHEPPVGYTIIGANTLIPEIDNALIGKKISNKTHKIEFVYPPGTNKTFVGQTVIYEFKIINIKKPKFATLTELFESKKGKKIGGYKSELEFLKQMEIDYVKPMQNVKDSLIQKNLCKQLIAQIPNFLLDDTFALDRSKDAKKQLKTVDKVKQQALLAFVECDFGKFEGDQNLSYPDQAYKINYDITKLENILSYMFIKYAPTIDVFIDQNEHPSETELKTEIKDENPDMDDLHLQVELGERQKVHNRWKVLDWLSRVVKAKGELVLKK